MAKDQSISVIVPVYRQWDYFRLFLRHWDRLDISRDDIELICVDNEPNSCPDDLPLPREARVVPCARRGSYAARNAGAEAASGAWLVFTDADCRPKSDWLTILQAAACKSKSGLLAGDVQMVLDGAASDFARFDLVRGIPQGRYISRGYAATANLAVPSELFARMGGFDFSRLSGGDAEFCRRARDQFKASLYFIPNAVVEHPARADWDALCTKARRVKGGQLANGTVGLRFYWFLRTCLPPLHELFFYLRAPHSRGTRLIACRVRLKLWVVELHEMIRLLCGRNLPERR